VYKCAEALNSEEEIASQFGKLQGEIDDLKKNKSMVQKTMLERINATRDAGNKEKVWGGIM
jgi:hypothetical protein